MRLVLLLGMLLTRVAYFFLLQGTHDGLYYIRLNNIKDILLYLIFAIFLSYCHLSRRTKLVAFFIQWYCYTFAVVMLYPFLDEKYRQHAQSVLWAFNAIWGLIGFCLLLYCLIRIKPKTT